MAYLLGHTYKIDDVGPQDTHAAAQHSPKRRACLAHTRGVRLHSNQVNYVERDCEAKLYKHNRASREPNQVGLCKDHRICWKLWTVTTATTNSTTTTYNSSSLLALQPCVGLGLLSPTAKPQSEGPLSTLRLAPTFRPVWNGWPYQELTLPPA
jgi:hypothetical protein